MAYIPYNEYRNGIMEKIQMDKFKAGFYTKSNLEKPAKDFTIETYYESIDY